MFSLIIYTDLSFTLHTHTHTSQTHVARVTSLCFPVYSQRRQALPSISISSDAALSFLSDSVIDQQLRKPFSVHIIVQGCSSQKPLLLVLGSLVRKGKISVDSLPKLKIAPRRKDR
ncbi:unnamed protein product [Leuciscus chuanchicus]